MTLAVFVPGQYFHEMSPLVIYEELELYEETNVVLRWQKIITETPTHPTLHMVECRS